MNRTERRQAEREARRAPAPYGQRPLTAKDIHAELARMRAQWTPVLEDLHPKVMAGEIGPGSDEWGLYADVLSILFGEDFDFESCRVFYPPPDAAA